MNSLKLGLQLKDFNAFRSPATTTIDDRVVSEH